MVPGSFVIISETLGTGAEKACRNLLKELRKVPP
jgi:hypothetical protein